MSTPTQSLPPAQLPESASSRPTQTAPTLHLYTAATPNGHKPSILLEELLLAYPENPSLSYNFHSLSFASNDQKTPEFLKINPNGRIPALVDDSVQVNGKGHNVFESVSILLWLVERYDKDAKFWFTNEVEKSLGLSWLFFGHGGVGPMQGQANHFTRYAPEDIPYGKKRYRDETARLYSVIEDHLKSTNSHYIVANKYSIVDISMFPWIRSHDWAHVSIDPFPNVKAWLDRIEARPGVVAGLGVPERRKKVLTEEEQKEQAKEASAWIMAGQEKK